MSLSRNKMVQDLAPEHIPAQDLAQLLSVIEKSCGSKDELKRLCQDPELKKILPDDSLEMIDISNIDLSTAVYNIVSRVIESGNLRPLINALKDFKSDVTDPLGKNTLRIFLEQQRSSNVSDSFRSK